MIIQKVTFSVLTLITMQCSCYTYSSSLFESHCMSGTTITCLPLKPVQFILAFAQLNSYDLNVAYIEGKTRHCRLMITIRKSFDSIRVRKCSSYLESIDVVGIIQLGMEL